jgi:hypothetical protein
MAKPHRDGYPVDGLMGPISKETQLGEQVLEHSERKGGNIVHDHHEHHGVAHSTSKFCKW